MTRGRAVLVALTVVFVGIGALAFTFGRGHRDSHRSAEPSSSSPRVGSQPLVWSAFAGLLLQHPSSWRSFQSQEGPLSSGPAQTIGYLTDQVVDTPECSSAVTSNSTTTSCHSIVAHLAPGGIVVTIVTAELTRPITGKTTIAGRPAVVTRSAAADCAGDDAGRTYEVDAQIQTSRPSNQNSSVTRTVVDACVAYPVSARTRRSIDRMLATARV
jgi:hypothetical protein